LLAQITGELELNADEPHLILLCHSGEPDTGIDWLDWSFLLFLRAFMVLLVLCIIFMLIGHRIYRHSARLKFLEEILAAEPLLEEYRDDDIEGGIELPEAR